MGFMRKVCVFNISLFSEFVKGKINVFAIFFSKFAKTMLDNENNSIYGYPTLNAIRGQMFPGISVLHTQYESWARSIFYGTSFIVLLVCGMVFVTGMRTT